MEGRISTTEASKMLEAALQQMDGIIATSATTNTNTNIAPGLCVDAGTDNSTDIRTKSLNTTIDETGSHALSEHNYISASNVLSTANTLALALQQVSLIAPPPDPITAVIISNWLDTHMPRQDSDERLRRLQRDKENLALQYQVLADKVDEQSHKIIELEKLLAERTQELSTKEELLHRQICTRSELETQKLELMNALSELKLHRAALERENLNLKNLENLALSTQKSTIMMTTTSTKPLYTYGSMGNLNMLLENSSTPKITGKTTPTLKSHRPTAAFFNSLPRIQISKSHKSKLPWIHLNTSSNNTSNKRTSLDNNALSKQRNVAFASYEKILIDDSDYDGVDNSPNAHSLPYQYSNQQQQQHFQDILHGLKTTGSPNLKDRSTKGLRNILGKLKRSNSGHLESLPDSIDRSDCGGEFKRGDRARSTVGGRIEYSRSVTPQSTIGTTIKHWPDWSIQDLCNWLCDLGFNCYENDCRKWLTKTTNSVKTFFSATPDELEKELNIKWPLHRKKLVLARDDLMGTEEDTLALQAAQLNVNWVLRWLDDIGLPQYKDSFIINKVDGRVLHRLTMEDLLQLQITSYLHIASLKTAIQCMREVHWQPECLIRRSTNTLSSSNANKSEIEERSSDVSSSIEECSDTIPTLIPLWTAHRVMEWLRVLDLSEYAPNLRGAGVHGALMIYEPRFNANLLADLLSIPPSKTLLRRHLATHFKELLGRDIIQSKRAAETEPNYQPLSITAKLKPPKKSQFTLKRRKNSKHLWINFNQSSDEIDWHEYICPMSNSSISTSSSNSLSINTSMTKNNNNNINNNINNNNNSNHNNSSNCSKT